MGDLGEGAKGERGKREKRDWTFITGAVFIWGEEHVPVHQPWLSEGTLMGTALGWADAERDKDSVS